MNKTFYSEYVRHCLRLYARYPRSRVTDVVDKINWDCCAYALDRFSQRERAVIVNVFCGGDTIADNVYQVAKKMNIKQDSIWALLSKAEKNVATVRGLI